MSTLAEEAFHRRCIHSSFRLLSPVYELLQPCLTPVPVTGAPLGKILTLTSNPSSTAEMSLHDCSFSSDRRLAVDWVQRKKGKEHLWTSPHNTDLVSRY